ncbi:NADH:flavin oxidoreductase/NADH oxidase [Hoeflea sp. WL0058]|uniref:NADH:flavin oxidoreductase/NADH oxidase n=1 Tax=Flavimaribacter sediminis TaxID=2865987 RepID=A0AAE2ZVW2_9HYPH|nr:NADH:flavin oxidoreductase/NADH oxidase [Flavimaribacter sediminis]MBW8640697.1 NADH:flavin oxidoreductase/NADH oxidase [Flavimaribacter sediminis]
MSNLFQPITVGGLALGNRIAISPMCQYSAEEGLAQSWHLIHIGGMMMSGAGLVIMEATAPEAAGRITHGCLGLYNDAHEEKLREIVTETRKLSSSRIGIQLSHAGRRASCRSVRDRWRGESLPPEEGAWQTWAPSALAYDDSWHCPAEMNADALARVRRAFKDSAERADRAGFDLLEIHGAHGYLLHQFLSPVTNRRRDLYGGDVVKCMRFPLEVAQAIREVWPADKALGFRMNSSDYHPDGLTLDDAVTLARELEAIGIDYVVMSAGNLAPGCKIPPATPGHQVEYAARIKSETGLTAMAVGLIVEPEQAEEIITSGKADMVAIARAALDNPRWPMHAAAALGVDMEYPPQYIRARPNNWTGFPIVHPNAREIKATRQMDRPSSGSWDRPEVVTITDS